MGKPNNNNNDKNNDKTPSTLASTSASTSTSKSGGYICADCLPSLSQPQTQPDLQSSYRAAVENAKLFLDQPIQEKVKAREVTICPTEKGWEIRARVEYK